MGGKVSGLPIERYIGIDPTRQLPLMICTDAGGRHWVTDGTRSAVIYPDEREPDAPGGSGYNFDYSVERAAALLAPVEPIIRDSLPYDALVYANWLVLATHELLLEYPQGALTVHRVALDRDSEEARDLSRVKVQGAEREFKVKKYLPRRPGHFDIEVFVADDTSVVLAGRHTLLDVTVDETYVVIPGEAREQAREIVERMLDFIWECRSFE
jgi:hypothetical protein